MGDLTLLDGAWAVCRLAPDAPVPALPDGAAFACVARTADELSVVVPESQAPPGARVEGGWRVLQVAGPLDLTATGVLAALADPLARAGVPVFPIATFDTDWLLVPGARLGQAVGALRAAGHRVTRPAAA
ncbi:MAG TPA: ACT domain-containing protein [Baekduia sp.]|nr:ACT domain-containing protein [Baekduia sp.]